MAQTLEELELNIQGPVSSPPIGLPAGNTQSNGRSTILFPVAGELDLPEATLKAPQLLSKNKKKRKKAKKNIAIPPAISSLRSAMNSSAISSDYDSDFSVDSFKKIPISSTNSPSIRPTSSCGGISALRQQLDGLALESCGDSIAMARTSSNLRSEYGSSTSAMSDAASDSDITDLTTSYEIPLEHDFVSTDVPDIDGKVSEVNMLLDETPRKMAATDFEPLTCLGKGAFGTVLLVKQKRTGRLYAQKQLRKATLTVHRRLIEQARTERAILESINSHPFVVKLYYAFQDHEKLYLILEYAQGGELFTHLSTERIFPEVTAAFYMAEAVLALEHLHHTVGVVYRDLKPENMMLDQDGHLLLTDFGLSKVGCGDDFCTSFLGTIEYMAPEIIEGSGYGMEVDWWSLGAVGVDLLTGSPPFQGNNHAKLYEKIRKQKLALPYYLGPDAKDLLTRLLRKEPKKRLGGNSPKDLLALKKHRFFRKIDWNLLEKREIEPPINPLITDPELAENFSHDFTELALSPVVQMRHQNVPWEGMPSSPPPTATDSNPFGGFSYVASPGLWLGAESLPSLTL
ncbi:serine/threonine protein kinase psk1 [Agyrium rufum]|nr:serine/threonine protein kinase psk1 [Agyrium rufum]